MTKQVTMAEARKIYIKAGGQFFSKETMNFWGTRIESGLYKNRTFITSEYDYTGTYRFFNVRRFSSDFKDIKTVGKFNEIKSKEKAKRLAQSV